MREYNKVLLSGEIIMEAAKLYKQAKSDVEYIPCILLAGAAIGIIHPLLEELKIKPNQLLFAEISAKMSAGKISTSIGFLRYIYNSLKHAGDKNRGIQPSKDLTLIANLKEEARNLIGDAIQDYKHIPPPFITQHDINVKFTDEFLDLLANGLEPHNRIQIEQP